MGTSNLMSHFLWESLRRFYDQNKLSSSFDNKKISSCFTKGKKNLVLSEHKKCLELKIYPLFRFPNYTMTYLNKQFEKIMISSCY